MKTLLIALAFLASIAHASNKCGYEVPDDSSHTYRPADGLTYREALSEFKSMKGIPGEAKFLTTCTQGNTRYIIVRYPQPKFGTNALVFPGVAYPSNCQKNLELFAIKAIEDLSGATSIAISTELTRRIGGNDSQTTFLLSGYENNSTVEWGAVITITDTDCGKVGSFAYYQSSK